MASSKSVPSGIPKSIDRQYTFPARPWKRILAFIFDILLVNMFIIAPFSGILKSLYNYTDFSSAYNAVMANSEGSGISAAAFLIMLYVTFMAILYLVLTEYLVGQSLGMVVFNLHVIRKDKTTPNLIQCIGRNIALIPLLPFLILWLVDPLFLLFKKERLSDIFTSTSVIERLPYSQDGW
jgi:uncharacterized RDD family membrane protein YckC